MKTIASKQGPIRVFAGGQTIADVSQDDVPAHDVVRVPSIIVKSRGHIGFTYYEKPFTHKTELWSYSISDPSVDQKFVYYYLLTQVSRLQALARATSVKLPQLGVKDTDALRVPVPPRQVQQEIVRILDTFADLEAELQGELEARRRQYEYSRLEIIKRLSAPLASLSHLGQWRGGVTPSKANRRYWDSGTIPWLASMDVSASDGREIRAKVTEAAVKETSLKIIPGPSVVVVMRDRTFSAEPYP